MNKKFLTFGILTIVLAGVFVPVAHVFAAETVSTAVISSMGPMGSLAALFTSDKFSLWESGAKFIGQALMTISSLVLVISGKIFDTVVEFSILNMAKNLSDSEGIGGGITAAWATLRDIANMCFIFVLLYAAFKTMFDSNFSNFQTTIKNIIIVALLINFSLFFSKVVIDASNIVSVGFYNSIATSNNADLSGSKNTGITGVETFKGVSGGYMRMLGIQTFFSANILDAQPGGKKLDAVQILILGIMSSVFMLVTAVVLLIAGIMFAARFIILIFLMILSPLALIAFIIPGQMGKFNEWKDALIAQSFFAPLYFALTWVVFKLGTSLITILKTPQAGQVAQATSWTNIVTAPSSAMALLLNYVLIIGFSIAALIFAKNMASKTTGFKAISGGIGTAAMGGTAWAARNSVGRVSGLVSEKYRDTLSKSTAGRAGLWLANKGGKASFDTRGLAETKLGKAAGASSMMGIAGKTGGKGGYVQAEKDKVERKAKYAKDVYGQTDTEKDEAKKREDRYNAEKLAEENRIKEERTTLADSNLMMAQLSGDQTRIRGAEEYKKQVAYRNKNKIYKDEEYTEAFRNGLKAEYEKYSKAGQRRQEEFAKRLDKSANIVTAAGSVVGAIAGGVVGGIPGAALGAGIGAGLGQANKASARKIRLESKGPSKEKKLADAYKAIADEIPPETPATPSTPTAPAGGETPPATPPNP